MSKASPSGGQPTADTQGLMRAVEEGETGLVRSLLAAGADADAASGRGETALMRAASRGYADVARVLLDAGADVSAEKEDGSTALSLAVFYGYAEVVRMLLVKGADPGARTPVGTTVEHWARAAGFTEIAELLRNADALRARDAGAVGAQVSRVGTKDAAEFFPPSGVFKTVVPFSEVTEPPDASQIHEPGVISHGPPSKRAAMEIQSRRAPVEESTRPGLEDEEEETLIPMRVALSPRPLALPAGRRKSRLPSWRVIVPCLAALLLGGVIGDAFWRSTRRQATLAEPATVTESATVAGAPQTGAAPPAADASTEDSQPDEVSQPEPATATPERKGATVASDVTSAKDARTREAENSSSPAAVVGARRAPVGGSPAPARARQMSSEEDRKNKAAAEAARAKAQSARRAQSARNPAPTSSSKDQSSPIFSPPPGKSGKRAVIQWP
ncbi:MAG: ankyrin repeat domain-containing protein [Acidobacteria bacterium]|nr:ankyrin repeat domain-containing protein [Acidobacteriota bacterium]